MVGHDFVLFSNCFFVCFVFLSNYNILPPEFHLNAIWSWHLLIFNDKLPIILNSFYSIIKFLETYIYSGNFTKSSKTLSNDAMTTIKQCGPSCCPVNKSNLSILYFLTNLRLFLIILHNAIYTIFPHGSAHFCFCLFVSFIYRVLICGHQVKQVCSLQMH